MGKILEVILTFIIGFILGSWGFYSILDMIKANKDKLRYKINTKIWMVLFSIWILYLITNLIW